MSSTSATSWLKWVKLGHLKKFPAWKLISGVLLRHLIWGKRQRPKNAFPIAKKKTLKCEQVHQCVLKEEKAFGPTEASPISGLLWPAMGFSRAVQTPQGTTNDDTGKSHPWWQILQDNSLQLSCLWWLLSNEKTHFGRMLCHLELKTVAHPPSSVWDPKKWFHMKCFLIQAMYYYCRTFGCAVRVFPPSFIVITNLVVLHT